MTPRLETTPGCFTDPRDEAWQTYRDHILRATADRTLEDDSAWKSERDRLHREFVKVFG
jgi:hypothetical protein